MSHKGIQRVTPFMIREKEKNSKLRLNNKLIEIIRENENNIEYIKKEINKFLLKIDVKKNKKAYKFFQTLNKTNQYAIYWRLQTAKRPETREKRLKQFIEMLTNEKKIY
jgi:hypothetical protein